MSLRLRLRNRFHDARARLFVDLLRPAAGMRLLDLGGADGSLAARICTFVPLDVTVADLGTMHRIAVHSRGFRHAELPPDGPLPFSDAEFDLVLSNSVIEHVTLPKEECRTAARVPEHEWRSRSRAAQRSFAAEISRVGRGFFVQTPHRGFPLDQHVHAPFTHWLSHDNACRIVAVTDRFWIKSCDGIVDWELFLPHELHEILPDARIHVERFAGLPKSIVAWRPV